MSRSVLLLLSILTLQGSGCDDFLRGVVKNLQTTINSDHAGFRKVFPKDYWISHNYNDNLLCNTDPCCVFRAATVLSDSWLQLRSQLWPEHHSFEFISNLIQALDDRGMTKGRFEDPDPSVLPSVSSSPENLLNFTSSVFSKWLELRCSTPVDTCSFPTLASPAGEEERAALASPAGEEERAALESKKVRLLTTRAVHMQDRGTEGETGMRLHTPPPTNRSPPSKGKSVKNKFLFTMTAYIGASCYVDCLDAAVERLLKLLKWISSMVHTKWFGALVGFFFSICTF